MRGALQEAVFPWKGEEKETVAGGRPLAKWGLWLPPPSDPSLHPAPPFHSMAAVQSCKRTGPWQSGATPTPGCRGCGHGPARLPPTPRLPHPRTSLLPQAESHVTAC